MKLLSGGPRRRMNRAKRIRSTSAVCSAFLMLSACATPINISGQDLPPEQRSTLHARRGITIDRIGVEPTKGRLFVMAPGLYPLEFTSRIDLGSADRSMESVLSVLQCKIEVEFRPGEKVRLSGKIESGSFDPATGYSERGLHTEISLESSIEGRSSIIDTSTCQSWIDCGRVDKTRMMPISCTSTRDADLDSPDGTN